MMAKAKKTETKTIKKTTTKKTKPEVAENGIVNHVKTEPIPMTEQMPIAHINFAKLATKDLPDIKLGKFNNSFVVNGIQHDHNKYGVILTYDNNGPKLFVIELDLVDVLFKVG
jgi:hypothetical protein